MEVEIWDLVVGSANCRNIKIMIKNVSSEKSNSGMLYFVCERWSNYP